MTNATVGDRELPIYCVDTTENKVALSFDAAWGVDSIIDTVCNHKALGPGRSFSVTMVQSIRQKR